ncbi:hypothetical protein B0T14DRAFT_194094 [Immersiella caudata]|uniref:C2H2-type domain-containing protein n=1 Tax=Immersiella caudata TaxID=314043 RepID=A0AA40C3Z5_9PEZI|nr:hypothetical protein B0T14DRAFT_194094 [Immersiella caudata]
MGEEELRDPILHDAGTKPPNSRKRRRVTKESCWACPFYKNDPVRHRRCRDCTLSRSADVTQHIARCHPEPLHCPTCGEVFDSDGSKNEHIRRRSCIEGTFHHTGATPDQIAAIRQTKPEANAPGAHTPMERQWYGKYAILFGNDATPPQSPYRSVLDDDNAKQMCDRIDAFVQQGYPDMVAQSEALDDRDLLARLQGYTGKLLYRLQGFILEPPRTSAAPGRGETANQTDLDMSLHGYPGRPLLAWSTSSQEYQHYFTSLATMGASSGGEALGGQDPPWFDGCLDQSYQ